MVNQQQKHIRTFQNEDRPLIKLLLFNEKSKLEINRIFMPIESTLLPQNIAKNDNIQTIDHFVRQLKTF
jgi:hypothetical protein